MTAPSGAGQAMLAVAAARSVSDARAARIAHYRQAMGPRADEVTEGASIAERMADVELLVAALPVSSTSSAIDTAHAAVDGLVRAAVRAGRRPTDVNRQALAKHLRRTHEALDLVVLTLGAQS